MTTIVQTLAANATLPFKSPARHFRLFSATGPVDVRYYRGGSEIAHDEGMTAGYAARFPEGFDSIRVTDVSGASNALKFTVSDADIRFDTPPTGSVTVSAPVTVANIPGVNGAYTRASVAAQDAITATQLYAANAARRALAIQNTDATKYLRVRVDGTAPTTATGIRVAPGGYWEPPAGFMPTGAVKVIAETAGGIAVEALEG